MRKHPRIDSGAREKKSNAGKKWRKAVTGNEKEGWKGGREGGGRDLEKN